MMDSVVAEPSPKPGKDDVTQLVIADLNARAEAGELKYGTRLQTFNGRNALKDAYLESMDTTLYLRQALAEIENLKVQLREAQNAASKGFEARFKAMSQYVHSWAKSKGFWDGGARNDGEMLMLMVSELAEALEALREGNPPDDKLPDFSSFEVELADVIIRIMDLAAARDLRIGAAILAKVEFNQTRPYKHGKAF